MNKTYPFLRFSLSLSCTLILSVWMDISSRELAQLCKKVTPSLFIDSSGSLTRKLRRGNRLGDVVDPSSRGFGLHARAEASFHQHVSTIPTTCGGWRQFQLLGGRLVRSRALSSHTSATIRPSTRPGGHGVDSPGRRLVPLSAQHCLGLAICGPICFAYNPRPNSAVGEGSRRLGVAQ